MWEGAYDLDLSRGSTNFAPMKPLSKLLTLPAAYVVNVALAFAVMMIGRIAYLAENFGHFAGEFTHGSLGTLVGGSLLFDASTIAYIYAPYTLLMLLPLAMVATPRWQRSAKYYYVAVTLAALVLNLMDAVYFRYTLRRTTSTVFSEFAAEGNLFSIIGWEVLRHWYFIALAAAVGFGLWKLYRQPRVSLPKPRRRFYFVQSVALLVAAFLTVVAIRGGVKHSIRPITVSNAAQFVAHPADAALVLNTPFSLIRTIGKDVYQRQSFYPDDLIESIYTPLHRPAPADTLRCRRNVVVIIVESFGREYIGAFNRDLEGGRYRGYTPFVDSLIDVSTTYRWSFCNGRKSIDGMPSILSGVPMMVEPYILTPQSMNTLSGLAGYLAPKATTRHSSTAPTIRAWASKPSPAAPASATTSGARSTTPTRSRAVPPTSTAGGQSGTNHSCNSSSAASTRCRSLSSPRCSPPQAITRSIYPRSMPTAFPKARSPSISAYATPTTPCAASSTRPAGSRGSATRSLSSPPTTPI